MLFTFLLSTMCLPCLLPCLMCLLPCLLPCQLLYLPPCLPSSSEEAGLVVALPSVLVIALPSVLLALLRRRPSCFLRAKYSSELLPVRVYELLSSLRYLCPCVDFVDRDECDDQSELVEGLPFPLLRMGVPLLRMGVPLLGTRLRGAGGLSGGAAL